MSFTTVDVGFGAKRFSFEGPDFGVLDSVKARDNEPDLDDDEEDDTEIGSLADFVVADHTSEPARSSQSNNTEALEAEVRSGHVTLPSLPPRRLGRSRRVIFCSSNVASDDPGAVYYDSIPSDALQDLHFTN